MVLFHQYLWPSHLSSFAFLLSVPLAVRTRSRAVTKQPNDWQLVVTDCSVYSSIFYPTITFDVVFCFKAKLFSKVQIFLFFTLSVYILLLPAYNITSLAQLATASCRLLPARATTGEWEVSEQTQNNEAAEFYKNECLKT